MPSSAAISSALHAVLFDHDGTLVDSEPVHLSLWQRVLEPLGAALDVETYKARHSGIPTPANAVDMVARFALPISAEELAAAKHAATVAWLAERPFPLMPQAHAIVARLRDAGLRLAIVTGAEAAGVERTLEGHGLGGMFELVVSGDDVARSKPAPHGYLQAMQRMGIAPGHCIALEDTEVGLRAATDAGLRALAIPHALSAQQDLSRAHARMENLTQAADWVLGRLPASR